MFCIHVLDLIILNQEEFHSRAGSEFKDSEGHTMLIYIPFWTYAQQERVAMRDGLLVCVIWDLYPAS